MHRPNALTSSFNALTSYFVYRVREIVNAWPHRNVDIDVKSVVSDLSENEKAILHYTWANIENFVGEQNKHFRLDCKQSTVQVIEKEEVSSVEEKGEMAFRSNAADVLPPQSFVPIQSVSVFFGDLSTRKVKRLIEVDTQLKQLYHVLRIQCFCIQNATRKCDSHSLPSMNKHNKNEPTNRMRLGKSTEQLFVVNRKWFDECGMNFTTYSTMIASFFCNRLKEDFLRYGIPSYWIPLTETLKTAQPAIQKIVSFVGMKRFALLFDRKTEAQVALLGTQSRPWVRNVSGLADKSTQPDEQTKAFLGDESSEFRSEADVRYAYWYGLSPRELTLLALSLPYERSIAAVRSNNYPKVKDLYRRSQLPEILVTYMFPEIFKGTQPDPTKSSSLMILAELPSIVRNYFAIRLSNTGRYEEERIEKLLYAKGFEARRKKLFEVFRNPDAMNGIGIKPLFDEEAKSEPPMSIENILRCVDNHLKEFESVSYRDLLTSTMDKLSAVDKEAFKKGIRVAHHNLLALLGDYPEIFQIQELSETVKDKTVYYHIVTRGAGSITADTTQYPRASPKSQNNLKKLRRPSMRDEENPYHDTDTLLKLLVRIRGERKGEVLSGSFMGALPLQAKEVIRQIGGMAEIMTQFSKYFSSVEKQVYGGIKNKAYLLTSEGRKLYNEICAENPPEKS